MSGGAGKQSVNRCQNCGKNLSLTDDKLRMDECAECHFHLVNGTRSIEAYNKWLRGEKWR